MTLTQDWAGETAHMLKQSQGFTTHPMLGEYEGSGFGVSPYPERTVEVSPAKNSERELAVLLTQFVVRNADLLRQPNHYVGGWLHEHTMLLDVSIVTLSKQVASRICEERSQLAFHEFA